MAVLLRVLWCIVLLLGSTQRGIAQSIDPAGEDPLRVALITAAPGAIYWQRFGHNAILIENTLTGESRMYNFGWFDFEQENFLLNFIQGRMLYLLAATDPARDVEGYRAEGRTVWLQQLDLDRAQKAALAHKLEVNALPENAEYRYDYYFSNCSTKVRDALDDVLGGTLKRQSLGRGRGETYRSLSLAYAQPIRWLSLGIHLGLGPAADRRLNFWEEAFLPLRLRDLVAEAKIVDASGSTRPLMVQQRTLFEGKFDDRIPDQPFWLWQFLLTGVAISTAVGLGLRSRHAGLRSVSAGLASGIALATGLIGLGLLGLWLATDHVIAWRNANALLCTPLALLLAIPLWRLRQIHQAAGSLTRSIALICLIGATLVLVSALLKLNPQAQADWLALLLPWHLMVFLSLMGRSEMRSA